VKAKEVVRRVAILGGVALAFALWLVTFEGCIFVFGCW